MQLHGSIGRITVKKSVAGDTVKTLSLEVFGDIAELYELLDKPLVIEVRAE